MTPPAEYRRRSDSGDGLLLRSPDAVLAALPYLLGFTPRDSAVLVWVGRKRILLTQRLDLPAESADLGPWLQAMWTHQAADRADELIVVLATESGEAPRLAEAVLSRAAESDLDVRDVLRLWEGRWWSLICNDPDCCGPQGRRVDARVQAAVAAEFTVMGVAPLADRADLVSSMAADPDAVTRVRPLVDTILDRLGESPRRRERWRDAAIQHVESVLTRDASEIDDAAAALVIAALADVRVRDTVMWESTRRAGDELQRGLDALIVVLRRAPTGRVAPAATCTATLAWLVGDGARALIAVERALADDPAYSLGILVLQSLQAGLPPDSWREALSGVSRDECRHGTAGARRRRRAS